MNFLGELSPGLEVTVAAGFYDENDMPLDVTPKRYVILEVFDSNTFAASQISPDPRLLLPGTLDRQFIIDSTDTIWSAQEINEGLRWIQTV